MKYAEKLKDPRWQKKRLQILERDKWMCRACCSTEKTLHVHHIFYIPEIDPWDVPDGLLVTFCKDCHEGNCENGPCSKCPDYKKDCFGEKECDAYQEALDLVVYLRQAIYERTGK